MRCVRAISAAAVCAVATAGPVPSLVTIPADYAAQYNASCLDGTPPAYWLAPGSDTTTLIVFLEGGGWCFGVADCVGRAGGYLGTSNGLAAEFDAGGLLSGNATNNPSFSNATRVFVHYCDGASFASNASAPVPSPADAAPGAPAQIWMRGRQNLQCVITHILAGLTATPQTMILSGGSAGALAVYLGIDYVATLLPPSVVLLGAPDAGFFLDAATYANASNYAYRSDIIAGDAVWQAVASGSPNAACLSHYGSSEGWRCLLAPYAAPFIATPLYISNSPYDMWQIGNVLQLPCNVGNWPGTCNAAEQAAYQSYREAFLTALQPALSANPRSGAWVPSCFVHEMNVDYCSTQPVPNCIGWNAYAINATAGVPPAVSLDQAFSAWVGVTAAAVRAERGASASVPAPVPAPALASVPAVLVDQVTYPNNPTCPYPTPKATVSRG